MAVLRRMIEAAAQAKKVKLDPFTYGVNFPTFLANSTRILPIPIQSDSDFLWVGTTSTVFTAANTLDPAPDMVFSILDAGSGRQLQNINLTFIGNTGTGQLPYVLPEPKIFSGNGVIQVTVVDRSGVQKLNVDLLFLGFKIFYTQGYSREMFEQGV